MVALPEELIEDILLRLPVKSLLKFKTASKKWYALISKDDEFAKRHLKQSSSSLLKNRLSFYQNHKDQAIAIFGSWDVDDESVRCIENDKTDSLEQRKAKRRKMESNIIAGAYSVLEIKLPTGILLTDIVGSANGLICLVPRYGSSCFFCLWNPSTGDCKKISGAALSKHDYSLSGFGYDSYSDDYKVVGNHGDLGLGIFSLKENSWRIYKHKIAYRFLRYTAQVFNGAFHWCTRTKIIALNLATGKFFNMKMPEETRLDYGWHIFFSNVKVFDWQGSFFLFGRGSLWVMKQYGNPKSWSKLATISIQQPVGFSMAKMKDSFPFKESLISPNSIHLGK